MIEAENTNTTNSLKNAIMASNEAGESAPDAALIALCDKFIATQEQIDAFKDPTDPTMRPLLKLNEEILDQIYDLKATTPAGHTARARAAVAWWPDLIDENSMPDGHHMVIIQAMLRDILSAK